MIDFETLKNIVEQDIERKRAERNKHAQHDCNFGSLTSYGDFNDTCDCPEEEE